MGWETSKCFNCGEPGHMAVNCPEDANRMEAHQARIDEVVAQWHNGEISLHSKRLAIVSENLAHYGGPLGGDKASLTRMP